MDLTCEALPGVRWGSGFVLGAVRGGLQVQSQIGGEGPCQLQQFHPRHQTVFHSLLPCFPFTPPSSQQVHQPGLVIHTVGHPLDGSTYGGGWIYHMDNRCVWVCDTWGEAVSVFVNT